MLATCLIGGTQLVLAALRGGYGWSAFWSNRSSLLFSGGCYGLAVALAVSALLIHQSSLLLTGRTTFEARKGIAYEAAERPLSCFLKQTTPLGAVLYGAIRGTVSSSSCEHKEQGAAMPVGGRDGEHAREHAGEPDAALASATPMIAPELETSTEPTSKA